jgi:hypothetical protein
MSRARVVALALVNWKGVFYERYLLDRHVTALEGANGAGKTTVMIAAYVVLLPDMSRLRFTNLGESGATGGDRGIWGRLGEPGRPSYTVLELGLEGDERVIAGVRLTRTAEPTVEPTAFLITGLPHTVRLSDILLVRQGDGAVNVYSRVQMQLFKAKQLAQKEVDKALADVGMTIEEVRAYLGKHPALAHAFHRAPHRAGCTSADLIYEVGARRRKLAFVRDRIVGAVTGQADREHADAHKKLLDVARKAAAKANKKKSIVSVAPEVDPEDQAAPPIPAGRKSLRVVN